MEKVLFVIWLTLLPTQLSKFFWPEWSLVAGVRIDYLGWVVYFADFFWVIWWLFYGRKIKIGKWFWILMIVNLFGSLRWEVSLFRWWRWYMLILFAKRWKGDLFFLNKILEKVIPIWLGIEFIVSIGQLASGASLQGIFYWLGERKFSYIEPGIAIMKLFGESFVRAYGTFSHPNSLGGFVGLCLVWWWGHYKKTRFWWTINWIALALIAMSGSRTVWICLLIIGLWWNKKYRKAKIAMGVILVLATFLSGVGFVGWDVDSFEKRVILARATWLSINKYWLLGVGLGNNIVSGAAGVWIKNKYWLQPVHNIGLLIFSEFGVIEGGVIIIWIYKIFREMNFEKWKIMALIFVFVTGMNDHYWLTLPQNMGLLAIVLVSIYDKRNSL